MSVMAAGLIVLVVPISDSHAASLSELQSKLKQAEEDLAKYKNLQETEQDKAEEHATAVSRTQAAINEVRGNIRSLESQMTTKQAEIDTTTKNIIQKSEELTQFNAELNDALASLYELTDTSDIEMVADDQNISHFADRSEYMQALQDRILENIASAEKIKKDLETTNAALNQQKNELAALKGDAEEKSSELASTRQQQSSLLNQAKANEAQFSARAKQLENEKRVLSREIFELRERLSRGYGGERLVFSTTSYPFQVGPNTWKPDPWKFYMSECTSYAAWKWYVHYGSSFRIDHDGNSGDAYNWPNLARARGYTTRHKPLANSVISWPRGPGMPYGHVAWVERVNPNGTIDITEYNWVSAHAFSRRENVDYTRWGNATFIYR